jgi:hypothetical protein
MTADLRDHVRACLVDRLTLTTQTYMSALVPPDAILAMRQRLLLGPPAAPALPTIITALPPKRRYTKRKRASATAAATADNDDAELLLQQLLEGGLLDALDSPPPAESYVVDDGALDFLDQFDWAREAADWDLDLLLLL